MNESLTHIVDGSCAQEYLIKAGFRGTFIDWLDVLHDGPLHGGPDWAQHVAMRATYLSSKGWTQADEARARLTERFIKLAESREREKVVWLTAELFDQLQLLELLAYIKDMGHPLEHVMLIELPTSIPMTSRARLADAFSRRKPVQANQLSLAQRAWSALTAADPTGLTELLNEDLTPLPYLQAALLRFCQEFPSQDHGLNLTQIRILEALKEGPMQPGPLFRRVSAQEEVAFMGDASFWWRLEDMASGDEPLIETEAGPLVSYLHHDFPKAHLILTRRGESILKGTTFWQNPEPPWIGGCDPKVQTWLWNEQTHQFSKS